METQWKHSRTEILSVQIKHDGFLKKFFVMYLLSLISMDFAQLFPLVIFSPPFFGSSLNQGLIFNRRTNEGGLMWKK